ncbi:MAG: hypothetical protein K0Q49_1016 [Haloplasmataceae bacterium]|jgi:hypothetical protein|nr:hypothetical protein [Haloplasmataceae bacterium]
MNKNILTFNVVIGFISLILLLRGVYLIDNSGRVATNIYFYLDDSFKKTFLSYLDGTNNVIQHYIKVVILKGVIYILISLCGLVFSCRNLNKELSIKQN